MPGFTEIVNPDNIGLAANAATAARYAEFVGRLLIGVPNKQVLGQLRFVSVVGVGLGIKGVYDTTKALAKGATKNEKIEGTLKIISDVSTIGYGVETFAHALHFAKAIHSVSWTPPLLIASAALNAIAMMLEMKGFRDTNKVSKEFRQQANLSQTVANYTLDDFRRGCNYLLDKKLVKQEGQDPDSKFISKYIYPDEAKLTHRLMKIQTDAEQKMNSNDPVEVEKGRKSLHTTMEALSKRITVKKWSHALAVLIDVITLVGVVLFFTPLAPIGCGLWLISLLLSLANRAVAHKLTKQFEKVVFDKV